jgi:chromosome segregation ATPase
MSEEINRLREELWKLRSNVSEIASRLSSAERQVDTTRKDVEKCRAGIRAIEEARTSVRLRLAATFAIGMTIVLYAALAHGFGWI